MIRSLAHKGLKGYFRNGEPLPASLMKHEEKLRYWLSVLNAVTCREDLHLTGAQLTKARPGYILKVEGTGAFTFELKDQGIEKLNFRLS